MQNGWFLRNNPFAWMLLYRRHRNFQSGIPRIKAWLPIGSGLVSLLTLHGVPSERITLLSNPVDTTKLLKLPLPKPEKRLRVGYVGAITEAKGARILAEALQGLDVELHVAGSGPLAGLLLEKLGQRVILHGQVPESSMDVFYSGVDVVAMPSLCAEAFGRVAVEAMAAGRPIIASDIGGFRDIVGKCAGATLVPTGSSRGLRDEISRYSEQHNLVKKNGMICRTHIGEKYSKQEISRIFSGFLDVIR
jgi:glycosyltransferase involved in cell wall biosynthesis